MGQKLKIIHIITGLHPGGAEKTLFKLLSSNTQTLREETVISLTPNCEYTKKIKSLGIPVFELSMQSFTQGLKSVYWLYSYLKRAKPHIISTWLVHANFLGSLISKIATPKAKIIWNVRSGFFPSGISKTSARICHYLCSLISHFIPNLIIYNSTHGKNNCESSRFNKKIGIVIPNCIETDKFKPSNTDREKTREHLGIDKKELLIGSIGRWAPEKDYITFMETARKLKEADSLNTKFLLCGRGLSEKNQELIEKLKSLELENDFILLGPQQNINQILPALDLFLFTSATESCPNALLEAMSAGIPCVSTEAGDARLILGEDFIAPIRNAQQLANLCTAILLKSEEKRALLGQTLRSIIQSNFDYKKNTQTYYQQYISLSYASLNK